MYVPGLIHSFFLSHMHVTTLESTVDKMIKGLRALNTNGCNPLSKGSTIINWPGSFECRLVCLVYFKTENTFFLKRDHKIKVK